MIKPHASCQVVILLWLIDTVVPHDLKLVCDPAVEKTHHDGTFFENKNWQSTLW